MERWLDGGSDTDEMPGADHDGRETPTPSAPTPREGTDTPEVSSKARADSPPAGAALQGDGSANTSRVRVALQHARHTQKTVAALLMELEALSRACGDSAGGPDWPADSDPDSGPCRRVENDGSPRSMTPPSSPERSPRGHEKGENGVAKHETKGDGDLAADPRAINLGLLKTPSKMSTRESFGKKMSLVKTRTLRPGLNKLRHVAQKLKFAQVATAPNKPRIAENDNLGWWQRNVDLMQQMKHTLTPQDEESMIVEEPSNCLTVAPTDRHRIAWDIICGTCILIECLVIPFSLGFNVRSDMTYTIVTTVFFALDIVANHFTGFQYHGFIVMKQELIWYRYWTKLFLLDLIATVPWDLMFNDDPGENDRVDASASVSRTYAAKFGKFSRIFRALRMVRLLKLRSIIKNLDKILPVKKFAKLSLFGSISKFFIVLAVVSHWLACLWAWVGDSHNVKSLYQWDLCEAGRECDPPGSIDYVECEPGGVCEPGVFGSPWMRRYGLESLESTASPSDFIWIKYAAATEFAVGMVTGFGSSFLPGTNAERVIFFVFEIICFLLNAYVTAKFIDVCNQVTAAETELNSKVFQVEDFLSSHPIPWWLRARVQHSLVLRYQEENRRKKIKTFDVVADLPEFLRSQVKEIIYHARLSHHPFFAKMNTQQKCAFCSVAEPLAYLREEMIVNPNIQDVPGLMFLVKGRVRSVGTTVTSQSETMKSSYTFSPPMWFGHGRFFNPSARSGHPGGSQMKALMAVEFSEIVCFSEERLPELCRSEYLKYKAGMFRKNCEICGDRGGHEARNCPGLSLTEEGVRHWFRESRASVAAIAAFQGFGAGRQSNAAGEVFPPKRTTVQQSQLDAAQQAAAEAAAEEEEEDDEQEPEGHT